MASDNETIAWLQRHEVELLAGADAIVGHGERHGAVQLALFQGQLGALKLTTSSFASKDPPPHPYIADVLRRTHDGSRLVTRAVGGELCNTIAENGALPGGSLRYWSG